MKTFVLVVMAVAGLGLSAAACDGSSGLGSGGGTCGKVQPCGGNLVGQWKVGGSCVNQAAFSMQVGAAFAEFCPSATVDSPNFGASGTLAFNADMTYALMVTTTGSFKMNIPSSCLAGATCAQLDAILKADPPPNTQSIACSGSGTCVCTAVLAPMMANETGTYSTAGTVVTTTPASGASPDAVEYCVQGTEGHFLSVDRTMNMGAMGQVTINQDIVATKQ